MRPLEKLWAFRPMGPQRRGRPVCNVLHGTVNGADALAVVPFSVHVTVCVPVPDFVVEAVPLLHATAPSCPATTVACNALAPLVSPEGSLAVAVQEAPGAVVAAT